MAAGPKLQAITAGSALIADTVMQNFQAVADFLRSMPANSLLEYKGTVAYTASNYGGIPAGSTYRLLQYHRVNLGNAPEQLDFTGILEIVAGLGGGDSVSMYWEKCTPTNGNFPVFADIWLALNGTITWDNTNTTVGVDNVQLDGGPNPRFIRKANMNGAPPIADGDWLRCRVQVVGATAVTAITSTINLKASIRG